MSRKRLNLGSDGILRDRDGVEFGRLTNVTIEIYAEEPRGAWGGEEVSSPVGSSVVGGDPQQALEISPDVVEKRNPVGGVGGSSTSGAMGRLWSLYQEVVPGAERRVLDSTTERIIRNALAVRDEQACAAAIEGLAKSAFHNGDNDRSKKYLGIRYALKGNQQTGETADERIDKMAGIAASAKTDLLAGIPSAGREMIRDRQRQVEEMLLHPGDANREARGKGSETYLRRQWGLRARVEEGSAPVGATTHDGRYVVWSKGEPE